MANVSLWDVICSPLNYGLDLNKGTQSKVNSFRDIISEFGQLIQTENADVAGRDIIKKSGIYADIYADTSSEGKSRQENIDEMLAGLESFCTSRMEEGNANVTLADYLSEVSLLSDLDSDESGSDDKVTLMTIHSAKGLEFNNVFIVGLEENLFPSQMALSSPREMEEERRLFYVAITRASLRCFLTFAKSRFRYGKMEFANKSRFIDDISSEYINRNSSTSGSGISANGGYKGFNSHSYNRQGGVFDKAPENRQHVYRQQTPRISVAQNYVPVSKAISGSNGAGKQLNVGATIEHERFGLGVVEKIEGVGENCKATVCFKHVGTKQLLLKFAKFKVL
jgi:DNA helicase-2/ATP-dependent DNA helicase PcrA